MNPAEWESVYPPGVQAALTGQVRILAPVMSPEQALQRPDLLGQMDLLLSGWGGPKLDQHFLDLAPHLQAVFYGAGAVGHLLTAAFWNRQIVITTANSVNAIPVSEFALAHILLGLKRAWPQALETRRLRSFLPSRLSAPGAYQSTVGLISLSTIGRLVRQRLVPFDLRVIAHDPTVEKVEAASLDVDLTPLEALFARSDVVSLHAPLIPETVGMITGTLLAGMKNGATFINTARGAIVCEKEMIEVLRARPDLTAVLDVTDPEPPLSDSPLFDLPNVVLTPHIAGSLHGECGRLGQWISDEVQRYLAGEPLRGQILAEA
jgi:phosphoglycerate dehydrogenase-like enzyme